MCVALQGGCCYCSLAFTKGIDFSKKYRIWEEKSFFGLFTSTYNEMNMCYQCIDKFKEKYSTINIRKRRIKKLL